MPMSETAIKFYAMASVEIKTIVGGPQLGGDLIDWVNTEHTHLENTVVLNNCINCTRTRIS